MNILNNAYLKCVSENERNVHVWNEYLNSLNSLDFSVFSDKLTVPALVPIGNRIFFRGQLKHTNEVTVALGADYFVKCSLKQAEVLRQHRIKDAKTKLDELTKEKEYLESQISFSKENIFGRTGQEIIEEYTEEEDKNWREKHRENVRRYKKQSKQTEVSTNEIKDEELWNRLEELELQEELQNELENMEYASTQLENSLIVKEPDTTIAKNKPQKNLDCNKSKEKEISMEPPDQSLKFDLLHQVLQKQNELEQKLLELKNKDRGQTRTEKDLISRLDEMEELDELEDEMDRLEDVLNSEDIEKNDEDNVNTKEPTTVKRGVTFADEDESETLEITFKHSDVEPCSEPYNPEMGISKPSDIYAVYSDLFVETTSILRKSKYKSDLNINNDIPIIKKVSMDSIPEDNVSTNKTIVVKDIIEKEEKSDNKMQDTGARPTSLFKKQRLQKKSSYKN